MLKLHANAFRKNSFGWLPNESIANEIHGESRTNNRCALSKLAGLTACSDARWAVDGVRCPTDYTV